MNNDKEVISQFIMTSHDFKIHQTFNSPIYLDKNRYNYYIRLLQVQFSNVVPNVDSNQYVEGQLICEPGIYSIDDLMTKYNALNYGNLTLNNNTGRLILTNDTGSTLTINNSNFLSSYICNFTLPITLSNNQSITANAIVKIQEYNYFVLNSGNISGYTYTSLDKTPFQSCTTIWPFSSAMNPFQFKTWTAVQPIEFNLDGQMLNYLDFEIKDAFGRNIKVLLGESDFMVTCQIVRALKTIR
jgi:hypothetical protein